MFPVWTFVSFARQMTIHHSSYKFVKGFAVKEDGSYELRLNKIQAGSYYLKFRHNEDAYGNFTEGDDSHVNSKGNSVKRTVKYGKSYEINAGISLTGALFRGVMWYDNDGDGEISAGEPGVSSGVVCLYRRKDDKSMRLDKVQTQPDGSFEIQLSSIDDDSTYYLKFLYDDGTEYEYSVVNDRGNSPEPQFKKEECTRSMLALLVLQTPAAFPPPRNKVFHTTCLISVKQSD